jgi:hypothetical protein
MTKTRIHPKTPTVVVVVLVVCFMVVLFSANCETTISQYLSTGLNKYLSHENVLISPRERN